MTSLTDIVRGDDYDIEREVAGIPASSILATAWLTIKASVHDPDPGLIQKTITGSAVAGVGHITDTGVSGTGRVLFQLTAANTLLLSTHATYRYDLQVKTSTGKIYTVERGILVVLDQVTASSS